MNSHFFLVETLLFTSPENPTTSVLTATTLIYAIGAGITAAAGTRLALQLFLARPPFLSEGGVKRM